MNLEAAILGLMEKPDAWEIDRILGYRGGNLILHTDAKIKVWTDQWRVTHEDVDLVFGFFATIRLYRAARRLLKEKALRAIERVE